MNKSIYGCGEPFKVRTTPNKVIHLQKNELNHIVSSVVKQVITEEMHIISKDLFPLASFIYKEIDNKIRNGENTIEFVISKEDVSKYYPYHNPQPLKIVCGLGVSKGKMEYKDETVIINLDFFIRTGKTDACRALYTNLPTLLMIMRAV